MRTRVTMFAVVVLLSCLSAAVPVALAQGHQTGQQVQQVQQQGHQGQPGRPCTMNTFTGTYVFYERGSSAILDPNKQALYPFHWVGQVAPFITVGQVTMWRGGVGDGFYWIRTGSFSGGADPLPIAVTITEMNPDCTGKFTYTLPSPGNPVPTTIVERFILFNNGDEFRTIPTEIQNGLTPLAWIGEGHRLSESGDLPHKGGAPESLDTRRNDDWHPYVRPCGPHTAKGTYMLSTENLVRMGQNPIFADAALLWFDVSTKGELAGTLYEKLGPTGNIQLPMTGTIAVAPDCSFAATVNVTIQGVPKSIPLRGLFFDEGQRFYAVHVGSGPTGTQWGFGQGQRINK